MTAGSGWHDNEFAEVQSHSFQQQQQQQPPYSSGSDQYKFQQQSQMLQSPPSVQQHHEMYTMQQQPQLPSQQYQRGGAQPQFLPSTSSPSASSSSPLRHSQGRARAGVSTLSSAFGHQQDTLIDPGQLAGQNYLGMGQEVGMINQDESFYSAEALMMGMGVDMSRSLADSSSSSSFVPSSLSASQMGGGLNEQQSQYGLTRPTTASPSIQLETQDMYRIMGSDSTSEASLASGSSVSDSHGISHQQLTAQMHQQQQMSMLPFEMQQRQNTNLTTQRSKKPAALQLYETHERPFSSPTWANTPNATTSQSHQERHNYSHPVSSPTWHSQMQSQNMPLQGMQQHGIQQTPNQHFQQQQHNHQHQQQKQAQSSDLHRKISSGLLSPADIGDSMLSEVQPSWQSTSVYNQDNSAPFVPHSHSFDLMRPMSSASGVSLTSSKGSEQSNTMQRKDSQGNPYQETPESALLSQWNAATGPNNSSQSSWLASPAGSDSSGQFQGQQNRSSLHQRPISTPQRLQQMRESIMISKQSPNSDQNNQSGSNTYTIPSANLIDFDYTEHRLSVALASNAQISSSSSGSSGVGHQSDVSVSSNRTHQRGNTTPTIMEEEEGANRRFFGGKSSSLQSTSSPSITQQQQQQQQHPQQQHPQQQQQQHAFASQYPQTAQDSLVRRRPQLRPNIYQQYTPFSSNYVDEPIRDLQDCTPFIEEVLSNYLASPSRLGLGERSVWIMTSKVAQKSYGAEKRFLCPPPMVLLVGSSWWSSCQSISRVTGNTPEPTILTPPRLSISMSGETSMQDSPLEWASSNGRLIEVGNPSSEMAISGRSIGRQLYINDSDEKRKHCEALVHITVPGLSGSDRRTLGTFPSKPIKVISKPSKKRQSTRTSDLSVNHGSTISLFHRLRSQTVSTRYLCVSGAPTWLKGSDGEPFLNSDYLINDVPNQGDSASCFVAKMSSWDPFIIYLVDPHIDSANASGSNTGKAPPLPGFPPPPINVIPLPANGQGPPICYNQAVVLQCLNTAVVSPVMVIRKVDRGTTVVGGGQSSSYSANAGKADPSIETLGDPVSQLHKIAFEVLEDPRAPAPSAENRDLGPPGQSGHFLGCLNEDVGLRKPVGLRQWAASTFSGPSTPTTPMTPMNYSLTSSNSLDSSKMLGESLNINMAAAAQAAAQTRLSMSQKRGGNMSPSSNSSMAGPSSSTSTSLHYNSSLGVDHNLHFDSGEEDGGNIKRPRRVSSSVVIMQKDRSNASGNSAKNRRRGQSLSIVGMQKELNSQQQHQQQQAAMQSSFSLTSPNDATRLSLRRTSSFANSLTNSETSSSLGIPAGAMWTVDVHDSDIWTIVGTDIARHTFYLPNKLVGGVKPKVDAMDQGIAHLVHVPAPASPITPLPILHSFTAPVNSNSNSNNNNQQPASSSSSSNKMTVVGSGGGSVSRTIGHKVNQSKGSKEFVTLIGENFSTDLFIYFGIWRSTRVTLESSNTIYCEAPPPLEEFGLPRGRVPIILVRRDGVVFPTPFIYSC